MEKVNRGNLLRLGRAVYLIVVILLCSMQLKYTVSAADVVGKVIASFDMENSSDGAIAYRSTVEHSTEYAISGTHALKVNSTSAYGLGGYYIGLSENRTYNFSFWGKLGEGAPYTDIGIAISYYENGNPVTKSIGTLEDLSIGGDFVQKVFSYTLPTGANSPLVYFFGDSSTPGGSFYIDDFVVTQSKAYINKSVPEDGAYNVILGQNMDIDFSVDMDLNTINTQNIKVNGGSDLISSIVTDPANPKHVKIIFQNLVNFTAYNVTMKNLKSIYDETCDDLTLTFVTQDASDRNTMELNMEDDWQIPNAVGDCFKCGFTDSYAYSGNRSLEIGIWEVDWALAGWWHGQDAYNVGDTVEISAWVKIAGNMYFDAINVRYPRGNIVGSFSNLTPGADFVKRKFLYTIPAGGLDGEGILNFVIPNHPRGTFYIDDFRVTVVGATKLLPISIPADNAQNVLPSDNISLKFNYDIDANSAITDNITINGGTVPITEITTNGNTINIVANLDYSKTYTITTSNIKDVVGRDLLNISKTFTTAPKYSVGTIEVYKDYGTAGQVELTGSALQAGSVTAVLDSFQNNTDSTKNVVVIATLYKEDSIVSVNYQKTTVGAGQSLSQPLSAVLTIPDLSEGDYRVKVFLWDDLDKMQPLDDNLELTE